MRYHLVIGTGMGLSAVLAFTMAWITADDGEVCRMVRDNQETATKLEEKRQRREAFVRVDKELADAVIEGRLSLEQGAQMLADYCTAEHACQLESLALELGEALPAGALACLSLLRSIRYYHECGAYQSVSTAVGNLLDAMPRGVWHGRESPNPWLSFIRGLPETMPAALAE